MTSTTMAVVASNNAMIAAQNARIEEMKNEQCRMLEPLYEPKTATTLQKREYAECVRRLYPDDMSPGCIIALKVVFVVCLVAGMIGAVIGEDPMERVFFLVMGMFLTAIGIGGVATLVYGIIWVFN